MIPPLRFSQKIQSDRVLAPCYACDRPLLEFYPRHGLYEGLWLHWECAEAIWPDCNQRIFRSATLTEEQRTYKDSLAAVRTTTLFSMLNTYECCPDERTAGIEWMIRLVRDEYDSRDDSV